MRLRIRTSAPTIALALATLPAAAAAATLEVPQQFATIQAAVDAAQAGDVIRIAKGVYVEHVGIAKSDLTIVAKKGAILDGSGSGAPLVLGGWSPPIVLNWIAGAATAALSIWGWSLARRA